jgi:hypothetical protein
MMRWLAGISVLTIVLFFGGWELVRLSGHGGNRLGGSPVVWQVGGLMVYASVLTLAATVVIAALVGVQWGVLRRATPDGSGCRATPSSS